MTFANWMPTQTVWTEVKDRNAKTLIIGNFQRLSRSD